MSIECSRFFFSHPIGRFIIIQSLIVSVVFLAYWLVFNKVPTNDDTIWMKVISFSFATSSLW